MESSFFNTSQIEQELCPPRLVLHKTDMQYLIGKCIYGWKREEEWLYIGKSERGLERVFSNGHHVLDLRYNMFANDKVYIWFFPFLTTKELNELERTIISAYEPKYNNSIFTPKMEDAPTKDDYLKAGWFEFNYNETIQKLELIKGMEKLGIVQASRTTNLPVPRKVLSRMYASNRYAQAFIKLDGIIFVHLKRLKALLKSNCVQKKGA